MSFGQGMSRGGAMAAAIPRPKFVSMSFTGAGPRRATAQPQQRQQAPQQQPARQMAAPQAVQQPQGDGGQAAHLDRVMEQNRYQDGQIDQIREEDKNRLQGIIGKDYDMAIASLAVGDTKMAEEFINSHGNKGANVKIEAGEKGQLRVTPEGTGKAMSFKDQREFYTNFFAAFKPQGSGYQLPEQAKQEWGAIADGTRILNKPTGEIRETGYVKPESGSGSGKGTSGSPSAGPLMEQADNYILNRVMDRMNQSAAQGGAELSPEAQRYMAETQGDPSTKKIDFDRVKQFMTEEEVQAYNLATTTAQQMKAEGAAPHIIANQIASGMRDMIEKKPHVSAQERAATAQGIGREVESRRLNPAQQPPPPPPAIEQGNPITQLKPDQQGFAQLETFLGGMQDPKQKEQALTQIAELNPELVIAYYEMMKKSGAGVTVPQPAR